MYYVYCIQVTQTTIANLLGRKSENKIRACFAPSPVSKGRRTLTEEEGAEAKQDGQIEWLISYVLSSAKLVPLSLSQTIKAKALRRCRTLYQVDIELLQLEGLRFCPVLLLHVAETYYVIMHGK